MRVLQITGLVLLWVWTGVQVATAASCADQVSFGDKSVGISGEEALDCPSAGGIGCFSGNIQCRFCMTLSTPQSSHLAACKTTASSTSTSPTMTPSVAPTVAPTSDEDCAEALTVA
ncbi:hypothetical protein L914_14086 [Phytophthora nicotianae]|uniref:Uncharacterized protein n=1 Tax=Phytophthora nicotianae TaxID=4792 RepID=W2MW21_PHYNI|nr:hypothetical protein L914_14086 [Phytophthora nicotianae]